MYFVVIVAFALLLADGLPPARWTLFHIDVTDPADVRFAAFLTAGIAACLLLLVGIVAAVGNRLAVRRHDGTHDGLDRVQEIYNTWSVVVLGAILLSLMFLLIATPWIPIVRTGWGLGRIPLAAELAILTPFFTSVFLAWACLYPADRLIRTAAMEQRVQDGARARPVWGLTEYLFYKFRHQVLLIAVPMTFVLLAKHYIDLYRAALNAATRIPWAADALIGLSSGLVLLCAPVVVAWTWATSPLAKGGLRDRLDAQCRRIGLRYRDILVWDSQGLIVNAAVMGFIAPLRYVMLSDGLLETMRPQQIEAVFGHEAGHVRHYHLQYFVVFAVLSMLIVGGVLEIVIRTLAIDPAILQLLAMALTLLVWGAGFGWVSRRFERQADIFGVRAITPDIEPCNVPCAVHGVTGAHAAADVAPGRVADAANEAVVATDYARLAPTPAALCLSAANVFGSTLQRIAELNGIPLQAPSWRHGSIASRCQLILKLASDPNAAARFDRRLWTIKAAMVTLTLIGVGIATWLYWPTEFIRELFPKP